MIISEELIDSYGNELDIFKLSYNLMGMLLDTASVHKRINSLGDTELFIYGTNYLGIQLYRTIRDFIKVIAVVDKYGNICLPVLDVPVISLQQFAEQYHGQKVIITPVKYYQEIRHDLKAFVPDDKMLYLGEFLEGFLC